MKPSPRFTVTFGSSSTVIFDQVGKVSPIGDGCVTSLRDARNAGEILPAAKYSRAPHAVHGRMRNSKFD